MEQIRLFDEDTRRQINQQGMALISKLVIKPVQKASPAKSQEPGPDDPVCATFKLEDIDDVISYSQGMDGRTIDKFILSSSGEIGVGIIEYPALRELAAFVQSAKEVERLLAYSTIEDEVLKWAVAQFKEPSALELAQCLVNKANQVVENQTFLVAVSGVRSAATLQIGKGRMEPLTQEFFNWWQSFIDPDDERQRTNQQMISEYRRRLQGKLAYVARVRCDPVLGRSIAKEDAEDALSILRFFMPSICDPYNISMCRPLNIDWYDCFVEIPDNCPPGYFEGCRETEVPELLSPQLLELTYNAGIAPLTRMYLTKSESEFKEKLWQSISMFSNSSVQESASDKLLYAVSALEGFVNTNRQSNIERNLIKKMQFTISEDESTRRDIELAVKNAYSLRSRYVHNLRTVKANETISKFLQFTQIFFLRLVLRCGEFKTRNEYFHHVEALSRKEQ